ncbi:MAG TPA: DUF1786 family protein [Dehalococcoidia bacterium]
MRILAIDVGTGTQDILLLDTDQPVENSVKMVMPSATEVAARRIRRATREGRAVLLTGVTMGGGPCHWALEEHLRQGLKAYATVEAAKTFDDDLAVVASMGVTVLSDDEARRLRGVERVTMKDLDLPAIRSAFAGFEVPLEIDGLAVGCLDHGEAPPGYSDRLFRFDHLRSVVSQWNDLRAFAYTPETVPVYLTRARAMLSCIDVDVPVAFLDTGPAAALGALQDPQVARHEEQVVVNLGNMHALAFYLRGTHVRALYEHHTGLLEPGEIERLTEGLVAGTLSHEEVFAHHGHGVYYAEPVNGGAPLVAVTGPQRGKLKGSRLQPYFATPHGDMMISGCFGMVQAFAERYPEHREEIERALLA